MSTAPEGATAQRIPTDVERQLAYAATTLRQVQPLPDADRTVLDSLLAGLPILAFMKERDDKRVELGRNAETLRLYQEQQAYPPEHGAPPNDEMVQAVAADVDRLSAEVQRLETLVEAGLTGLGIGENELAFYLRDRFPAIFEERAKTIALAELAQNRAIVEREAEAYGVGMCADPKGRQALRGAASELLDLQVRIRAAETRVSQARSATDLPIAGVPEETSVSSSYVDLQRAQRELAELGARYQERRARLSLAFPILFQNIDLAALAGSDEESFQSTAGDKLSSILAAIGDTQENIASGRLKVWSLTHVVDTTKLDLGIESQPMLIAALQEHVNSEQADEALRTAALVALAITAGVVAVIAPPLGAPGVGAAAGALGLGIGAYQFSESLKGYLAESAAANTALDPAARLMASEPDLGWLILDLIALGLDAVVVVSAVAKLRTAVRTAMATGSLLEASEKIEQVLGPERGARVLRTLGRMLGGKALTERVVDAVGGAFKAADLDMIAVRLEQLSGRTYEALFRELESNGRVFPLTKEGLIEAFGETEGLKRVPRYLGEAGVYHKPTGRLFIPPGRVDAVAKAVVHEATHELQVRFAANLSNYECELQAIAMEQRYLRKLVETTGSVDMVPQNRRMLLSASEEELANLVTASYRGQGIVRPTGLDARAAVQKALDMIAAVPE